MILVGRAYGFDVFTKTPFYVFFSVYFLITSAYISMACFFSTLMTTRSQAFSVNFSLILCSMLINMILSEPTILKKIFFNTKQPLWLYFTTNLFYFVPCFQFGKIFADISSVTCANFDITAFNWVKS